MNQQSTKVNPSIYLASMYDVPLYEIQRELDRKMSKEPPTLIGYTNKIGHDVVIPFNDHVTSSHNFQYRMKAHYPSIDTHSRTRYGNLASQAEKELYSDVCRKNHF